MARVTLIGNDAKLSLATLGTIETGSTDAVGAATAVAGYYLVATKATGTTSGIPADVNINQLFYASSVGAVELTGGSTDTTEYDSAYPVTFTDKCDIDSWSIELTRPEVDVTTLCDPRS